MYRKNEEFVVRYYEADAEHDSQRCDSGLLTTVKKIIEEILQDGHKSVVPLTQAHIYRVIDPVPPRNQLRNYPNGEKEGVK